MKNHEKVIKFPCRLDPRWRFFDYTTRSGSSVIDAWVGTLSPAGVEIFNGILKNNSKTETPHQWTASKQLRGKPREHKICEFFFKDERKQQRVLYVLDEEHRKCCLLLVGCTHKQQRYDPPDCLKTAIDRAVELKQNGWSQDGLKERAVQENL